MALTGVHVACGYIGGKSGASARSLLLAQVAWSQTMTNAGATSLAAPSISEITGDPSFEVRASYDVFVAIGPSPSASTDPRFFLPANETRNVFCAPGDKLAWIAA